MSYIGDFDNFSFRDNFCEFTGGDNASSAFALMGRKASGIFQSIAVACSDTDSEYLLMAFSAGASEGGANIFVCSSTSLPALKYAASVTGYECAAFITGGKTPKISFFYANGFPVPDLKMTAVMNCTPDTERCLAGKIASASGFSDIYTEFLRKNCNIAEPLPLKAGVSCGNRYIRRLWLQFFNDCDDTLIFQISDDGQKVNAYCTELGFVSYDRLVLAYAVKLWRKGQTVWLPECFHFSAEETARKEGYLLKKYNPCEEIPKQASSQRFLTDPLFLCLSLAPTKDSFINALRDIPAFTSAKRELPASLGENAPYNKSIVEKGGRVIISQSGNNRISLTAQAYDTETASELCALWTEKVRKLSSCNNLFQRDR